MAYYLITGAPWESTTVSYKSSLKKRVGWRSWKEINSFQFDINPILEFLGELFVAGQEYRTIGTHRSTISLYYDLVKEMKVGVQPKVSAMQGVLSATPT